MCAGRILTDSDRFVCESKREVDSMREEEEGGGGGRGGAEVIEGVEEY